MSKKHNKVCATVNCIKNFLNLAFTITRCVCNAAFGSLVGITLGITKSAVGLTICVKATGIKKYRLIIGKKEKKHDNSTVT